LLKRFQLVSVGEIESEPGLPPSRQHTRDLIERMKRDNVKVILVEPFFETETPNTIARETGAQVVILPSSVGGAKGVSSYLQLYSHDLGLLATAFKQHP
jgi:zinc/manganese transport system substrate-binding protein/zinc transport system substrate-binding protein